MTRNFFAVLAALALGAGAVQAQEKTGPLVGPGVAGAEKDEKGGVKGADAGAGSHRNFHPQFERRVDRPEEAIEKEKKAKEEKARQEERAGNRGQSPNSQSGRGGS